MDEIKDKIRGMIFGQCLGNAVGNITTFKTRTDKTPIVFPYGESIRKLAPNDWTDAADHMILIMKLLTEKDRIDVKDVAVKLKEWIKTGIPELSSHAGPRLCGTATPMTTFIYAHPKYDTDPFAASAEMWFRSGKKFASNGSVIRTPVLSVYSDPSDVEEKSSQLSKITNYDPRCIASCVLLNDMLRSLIHEPQRSADIVLVDAVKRARPYIDKEEAPTEYNMRVQPIPRVYWDERFKTREEELAWWVKTGYTQPISALKLDELGKVSHVFKCLGAAIYAMQIIKYSQDNEMRPSFKRSIIKVAAECGDANANCAVAGAILGAYIGYNHLPQSWIQALPHHEWLEHQVDAFLAHLYPEPEHRGPTHGDEEVPGMWISTEEPKNNIDDLIITDIDLTDVAQSIEQLSGDLPKTDEVPTLELQYSL